MDTELLSGLAGIALSLLFSYLPMLAGWFDKKDNNTKRGIMGAVLLVTALGVFGLSCVNAPFLVGQTCDREGFWGLVRLTVMALVANQSMYLITPQTKGQEL